MKDWPELAKDKQVREIAKQMLKVKDPPMERNHEDLEEMSFGLDNDGHDDARSRWKEFVIVMVMVWQWHSYFLLPLLKCHKLNNYHAPFNDNDGHSDILILVRSTILSKKGKGSLTGHYLEWYATNSHAWLFLSSSLSDLHLPAKK